MTLEFEHLKKEICLGNIDTVVVACVDMQSRLIGRRMTGHHFLSETVANGKMCLNPYFLICSIESIRGDGYELWDMGRGDCHAVTDLGTLRRTPWVEGGAALVLADLQEKLSGEPVYCSPRWMLRQQVDRLLSAYGLVGKFASELEFHLFSESHQSARQKRWQGLETAQPHYQWMNIQNSSATEPFMRQVRNNLEAAGILLEATHPEWAPSQQELNFVPAEPMEMADRHVLAKHAIHEMAKQQSLAATFMAKYNSAMPGSSCHIHMSLQHADTGKPAFHDANDEFGMSKLMRHWLAGLIKYAPEYTYFLAPYINSYKRLQPNTFAPTKCCWALDNRTSAFRLCNERTPGVHVEIRVGGADLNPYLAYAAIIAAGLAGLDEELPLESPVSGNAYANTELLEFPHSLREATEQMLQSEMLKKNFGEKAHRHYVNAARVEQAEFEKQVTDWELARGFDRY